ncbi:MAG: MoaD/ThiS family protein [Actinomycetota bacterium]|nr:MoaD/ThiS family protein [Actinomycetota bacterium]
MSVKVKIPTQLRALTGGATEVPATGSTVAEVVADLEAQHPGMRERLMDGSGSLRRFVNVYIDEEDVRFLQGLDTEVGDGARVSIIPAVAGGASGTLGFRRAEPSCL